MSAHAAMLRMLQDDLAGEHAAIIQYLQHVWRMGDAGGDIPCEVEEIARDEMRHFRWVAELVVDLGADPTIERDVIYLNGSPPADLMLLDIDAENRAIAQYVAHTHEIEDRRVTRVIERILVDERAHREKFRGYVAALGGDPDAPSPRPGVGPFSGQRASNGSIQAEASAAPESTGPFSQEHPPTNEVIYVEPYHAPAGLDLPPGHDQLVAALNSDIGREYTTVLQYLFQSFVNKSNRLGKELQLDLAQWHMKHWGWMAERVAELGGDVSTHHDGIDRTRDAGYVIRSDIERQQALANHYAEEMQGLDDEESRRTAARIHAHDVYQIRQLEDMQAALEAGELEGTFPEAPRPAAAPPSPPPAPRLTVGDLFGQPQD
ncbi:MAG TPA: ferritin-like domain-containing protein [Chloroflexota bacterium]